MFSEYFWSRAADGWYELYTSRKELTLLVCRAPYEENVKQIARALTLIEQTPTAS